MRQFFEQIKRLKTITSEFFPTHLVGSGVLMNQLSDAHVQVNVPLIWTNQNRGGSLLSVGVVVSAAEMAVKAVLDRHLPKVAHRVTYVSWTWQSHVPLDRAIVLKYNWDNEEREAFLSESFRGGESSLTGEVLGFFEDDRLACTLAFVASVRALQALPQGQGL